MIFVISISAEAKIKIGDEFVLKKQIQNIKNDTAHLMIDGIKTSKYFELPTKEDPQKYECQIGFYRQGQYYPADYRPGADFEVIAVKKYTDFDIISFPFNYDYNGWMQIDLKEKGKDTLEMTNIVCITRSWYGSKWMALLNAADSEVMMEALNELYEAK